MLEMLIKLFFVLYKVPAAWILNLSLPEWKVHNHKPKSKHTANANPDPNSIPFPNGNTYSLMQSGC